ncbi:uncharacterized protein K02A2.6-like [Ornithodoros turicata]|uniref:uncharacterized protein K02A2.6-like n=1 Tax=Ornithodoros turicata TaxID=34597 RepID=UPI0031396C73
MDPLEVTLLVDKNPLRLEIDTGAAVSVLPLELYNEKFSHLPKQESRVVLKSFTGEKVRPIGEVQVEQGTEEYSLNFQVIDFDGPPLLGRDWLEVIKVDWKSIKTLKACKGREANVECILEEFKDVFADELGCIRDFEAKVRMHDDAAPLFHKARPVPYALRDAVAAELREMQSMGILTSVETSEYASPIVPVPKKNGKIRVCGDYKVSINKVIEVDSYPLPRIEDLFATLAGGQLFTKLDLAKAYLQVQMEEQSRRYLTINTHLGLFQVNRLPFGIASAPSIFQRTMDQILQGIPYTTCYIDDILVTGRTMKEHLSNLKEVLKRLKDRGIRLQKEKCELFKEEVSYLGHKISGGGLTTQDDKVAAMRDAPVPEDRAQLRSLLGLANYYGRFILNLATVLHPLNRLLRKDIPWKCRSRWQVCRLIVSRCSYHYRYCKPT